MTFIDIIGSISLFIEQITLISFLGYFALVFGVTSYLFKDDTKFKIFQALCAGLFAAHFYLLGAYSGAVSVGVGFLSLTLSLCFNNNKNINNFFIGTYFLLLLYGIYTYNPEQWFEILPYVSNIFWVFAMLVFTGQKTHFTLIAVIACWIAYALET